MSRERAAEPQSPDETVRYSNPLSAENLKKEAELEVTKVSASLFQTPFKALGASGGTAAFFRVEYKDDEWRKDQTQAGVPIDSKDYWIGKDLARARDEVAFYEEAQKVRSRGRRRTVRDRCTEINSLFRSHTLFCRAGFAQRIGQKGWEVLNWLTPYKGCVDAPTDIGDREVLLLRNARDKYGTCRLLDIKIGEVTAVGGWQGKGHFMAWTQKWLDGVTNSNGQGFRLEGFDGPPQSMKSIFDHADSERHGISKVKMERFLMQRQPAKEFLKFFLDLHDTSNSTYSGSPPAQAVLPDVNSGLAERLSIVETEELVLLNCIEELALLAEACRNTEVAQQWIGSSVMLAFDADIQLLRNDLQEAEALPSGAAAKIARARVHIFDWGRSELNTPENHNELWWEHKQARETYWGHYCSGIALLLYDCCLVYARRFLCDHNSVSISVWDRDVYTEDDLIGLTTVALKATDGVVTTGLEDTKGISCHADGGEGGKRTTELSFSIQELLVPEPTRLQGCWAVTAHRVNNTAKMDLMSKSDGVAHVQAYCEPAHESKAAINSRDSGHADVYTTAQSLLRTAARSTTVAADVDSPVWEETFELGTLKQEGRRPFIQALLRAFAGDGGLELDPDYDELAGYFIEKKRSVFHEHQVVELKKYSLGSFFPMTLEEGFGTDNHDRENKFMHYCFPELDRKGDLGKSERSGIKYAREVWAAIGVVLLVIFILVAFFGYEFW